MPVHGLLRANLSGQAQGSGLGIAVEKKATGTVPPVKAPVLRPVVGSPLASPNTSAWTVPLNAEALGVPYPERTKRPVSGIRPEDTVDLLRSRANLGAMRQADRGPRDTFGAYVESRSRLRLEAERDPYGFAAMLLSGSLSAGTMYASFVPTTGSLGWWG